MASKHVYTDCCSNNFGKLPAEKLIYPAAIRNKEPILKVLKQYLTENEEDRVLFLEIASGSGQHVSHFAPQFPSVQFQPTEKDASLLYSIDGYARDCPTKNINHPLLLDITNNLSDYNFQENSIEYVYNANMIHISPYECTIGLFQNAGIYLKECGLLFIYGPFSNNGVIEPESNVLFNKSLKSRDPKWGLRDISDLKNLGEKNYLHLLNIVDMPSNNKMLVWQKHHSVMCSHKK